MVTWYKGTQKLEGSDKYNISSVGLRHCLHINNCQASDQGNYRVVCGPHISNAKLAVSGKTISCPGLSALPVPVEPDWPHTLTSFSLLFVWILSVSCPLFLFHSEMNPEFLQLLSESI